MCVVLIFRFSVFFFFSPFVSVPFFYFFLFQAVDCLLNRTRVSDVVEKGTGAPRVEDTGADTNLGPASERKPKAPLSPPPGAIDNEETPGLLPDNCSSYFFAGWQCYLPCFEESSITPCRVAVSFTQLKERSSAPSPVGRVLYAGWRFVLV